MVPHIIEGDDDLFKIDVTVAERAEIPVAAWIGESGVSAKHSGRPIAVAPPDILHVHVVDAIAEDSNEFHVIHVLIAKVGGIVVESESLVLLHSFNSTLRRRDVEGDLRRMDLKREVDVLLLKSIENRPPSFGE